MSSTPQVAPSVRAGKAAPLEVECLKILWKQTEASVAQVRAGLPRPLAHTTVMTILDRMRVKGLVTRRKRGRSWCYAAALDLDSARSHAVGQLVANFFGNDPRALVHYVLSDRGSPRKVSPAIDDTLL